MISYVLVFFNYFHWLMNGSFYHEHINFITFIPLILFGIIELCGEALFLSLITEIIVRIINFVRERNKR